jgi:hypothetical protein
MDTLAGVSAIAADGRIRLLAVGTARPAPSHPQLPTLESLGLAPFDLSTWNAMLAPAATPPERVALLARAVHAAGCTRFRQHFVDFVRLCSAPWLPYRYACELVDRRCIRARSRFVTLIRMHRRCIRTLPSSPALRLAATHLFGRLALISSSSSGPNIPSRSTGGERPCIFQCPRRERRR